MTFIPDRTPGKLRVEAEAKTAETFKVDRDGVRWVIPGDWATVEEDGSITLFGRGSVSINSGGEKIFPEEVEEALKTHPAVLDAVVVGTPHERFGEMVVGVVQRRPGHDVAEHDLIDHVRERLAAYKAPRRIVDVETIGRAPNGKVDYQQLRDDAITHVKNGDR